MKKEINILFFGDVVGEHSLDLLVKSLSNIQDKHDADFIIVNGENVWQGKGINPQEAGRLFKNGVDVITTGNHIWENWKSRPLLDENPKVIRPANYPAGNPGSGICTVEKNEIKYNVMQLQGRTFLQTIDCPFRKADELIGQIEKNTISILDFHAETTAEKMAMAWYLDGRVTAMVGTHTHIQTADACIMPSGMAYITDVGMCGPYDSVLGMDKEIALKRFLLQTAHKFELATEDIRLAYVLITIDTSNMQAVSIDNFIFPQFEKSTR